MTKKELANLIKQAYQTAFESAHGAAIGTVAAVLLDHALRDPEQPDNPCRNALLEKESQTPHKALQIGS